MCWGGGLKASVDETVGVWNSRRGSRFWPAAFQDNCVKWQRRQTTADHIGGPAARTSPHIWTQSKRQTWTRAESSPQRETRLNNRDGIFHTYISSYLVTYIWCQVHTVVNTNSRVGVNTWFVRGLLYNYRLTHFLFYELLNVPTSVGRGGGGARRG